MNSYTQHPDSAKILADNISEEMPYRLHPNDIKEIAKALKLEMTKVITGEAAHHEASNEVHSWG